MEITITGNSPSFKHATLFVCFVKFCKIVSNIALLLVLFSAQTWWEELKGTQIGCVKVTHFKVTNSKFSVIWARMNNHEAFLMGSLRKVDSKLWYSR